MGFFKDFFWNYLAYARRKLKSFHQNLLTWRKKQILSHQKSLRVTWKRIKGINFWSYIKSSQWEVKYMRNRNSSLGKCSWQHCSIIFFKMFPNCATCRVYMCLPSAPWDESELSSQEREGTLCISDSLCLN